MYVCIVENLLKSDFFLITHGYYLYDRCFLKINSHIFGPKVHGGAVEVAQCFLGSNATVPALVDKEKLVVYKQQLR